MRTSSSNVELPAASEARALCRLLDELDYYQLLEIPRDASASRLKEAYYSSSRRFHPDAHRHRDEELREAVEQIAKRLTEAYSVLRDPRRRRVYDQRLEGDGGALRLQLAEAQAAAEEQEKIATTPQGERFFRMATLEANRGDLASAVRNLQMALTFEPGNAAIKQKLQELREKL